LILLLASATPLLPIFPMPPFLIRLLMLMLTRIRYMTYFRCCRRCFAAITAAMPRRCRRAIFRRAMPTVDAIISPPIRCLTAITPPLFRH
jgi:hypothetical protein